MKGRRQRKETSIPLIYAAITYNVNIESHWTFCIFLGQFIVIQSFKKNFVTHNFCTTKIKRTNYLMSRQHMMLCKLRIKTKKKPALTNFSFAEWVGLSGWRVLPFQSLAPLAFLVRINAKWIHQHFTYTLHYCITQAPKYFSKMFLSF